MPEVRTPPILHLLAGINGAGKTTLYYRQIQPHAKIPFINADEIQQRLWPDERDPRRSYEAAKIAETQRLEQIRSGKSFAAETVFSHPSKLERGRALHIDENLPEWVHRQYGREIKIYRILNARPD